jgi:DMSO/TMAO reductase YedYZ molybdopterin-dependent catalytic subunit
MGSKKSGIVGIPRRIFLRLTGGMFFMTTIPSTIAGFFIRTLPVRTVEKSTLKFYPDTGFVDLDSKKEPYRLVVDGLVKELRSFSYADIKSLPQVEQVSDFHCVEGWSVKDLKWGGFRFKEILNRVEPGRDATHVLFHSLGMTESSPKGQSHYIESFPLSELRDPEREILFVLTMDGRTLPEENGGPLRLIAPYDLAYKSIKFISRIEFIKGERPGWWTLANPIYTAVARVPKGRLRRK